jgi:hypothetical protein
MQISGYVGSTELRGWTKALHLFYAGLYAFVLPLICWGAQATPGHPHARAHFVFVDPEQQALDDVASLHLLHAMPQLAELHLPTIMCHLPNTHNAPVGQSVPMQMVIGSLIPVGALISLLPAQAGGVGFSVWLAESIIAPFHATVPTPPPR